MSQNQLEGKLEPLPDGVLITDIEQGERKTKAGIIIADDDTKQHGIRPRWAKVYAVGNEVDYVKPGEWVLVEHARWTRAVTDSDGCEVRMADPKDILLASEETPV